MYTYIVPVICCCSASAPMSPRQCFSFTVLNEQSDSGVPLAVFSLKSNLFCAAGEQLQINQPNVYDCDVPESLASLVPALAAVCKKKHLSGHISHIKPVSNRSVTLTSKDGTDFISFAKGASFKNGMTLKR